MNLPLAPLIALVAGGLAALGVAMIPVPALEALVMDSGLPSILAMAEPPLGMTARIAVALGSGAFVGAFMWLSAFILLGSRGLTIGGDAAEPVDPEEVAVPVLRRADAHPDAPPRPPLLATRDLGRPFLEVSAAAPAEVEDKVDFDAIFPPRPMTAPVEEAPKVHEVHAEDVFEAEAEAPESPESHDTCAREAVPPAEQELPTDFDQPLSAFDPQAIPAVPKPAPVPLAPLRRQPRPSIFDEGERFEIFELTPPVRPHVPAPMPEQPRERRGTDASIHALLDRLERGVADKGLGTTQATAKANERGLEEALVTLRNLARRTA